MMIAEYLPYKMQKALDLIPLVGSSTDIFRTNTFRIFGKLIWSPYLVTISTYYNSCLDWYSMYAIRYKELVKKDEGINNNMAKKKVRPGDTFSNQMW